MSPPADGRPQGGPPQATRLQRAGASAPLMMVSASLLFALMGVGVKAASAHYGTGEIVLYRSLIGCLIMAAVMRWQRVPLATPVLRLHIGRSLAGVTALALWFYAFGGLPLATAMTLNYMSSVWMAVFLLGGALLVGRLAEFDLRLLAAILAGFAGVALVLQPSFAAQQGQYALAGLLSGVLSAVAYLQVAGLGRAGEPELRVVFYFSLGGVIGGLPIALAMGGFHAHTVQGAFWLVAIAVLATAAQIALTRAYAIGRPMANAALNYLGVIWSCLFGWWFFDDVLTAHVLLGMALIVVAGLIANALRQRFVPPREDAGAGPG